MGAKKIVVTGGCGYIGSHTLVELIQAGYEVISIDSHINSDESALYGIERICGLRPKNYKLDLSNPASIDFLLKEIDNVEAIIHFAALKAVGESVTHALKYYNNNINSLIQILRWMELADIKKLIFSSSCTVYGDTLDLPVTEETKFGVAASPYGKTKQIGEQLLIDVIPNINAQAISLRYFNPAGAHISNEIGESPINAALNLVPAITETAIGKRAHLVVFGTDYPTKDGSCVRDYIHVTDLARAHVLALNHLESGNQNTPCDQFNLGSGKGYSVLEIIEIFERITNNKLKYSIGNKRAGDLPEMYANFNKAKSILNWTPQISIEDIIRTAWYWEQKRSR